MTIKDDISPIKDSSAMMKFARENYQCCLLTSIRKRVQMILTVKFLTGVKALLILLNGTANHHRRVSSVDFVIIKQAQAHGQLMNSHRNKVNITMEEVLYRYHGIITMDTSQKSSLMMSCIYSKIQT